MFRKQEREQDSKQKDDRDLDTLHIINTQIQRCVDLLSQCKNLEDLKITINCINILQSLMKDRIDTLYKIELSKVSESYERDCGKYAPGVLKAKRYDVEHKRVFKHFEALVGLANRAGYFGTS